MLTQQFHINIISMFLQMDWGLTLPKHR